MYHVARTLVALSNKGVLVMLVVTFAVFITLGIYVSKWCFIIPLVLMVMRMLYTLATVIESATKNGWPQTLKEIQVSIEMVHEENRVEEAATKARLEANLAKLRGEEPESLNNQKAALAKELVGKYEISCAMGDSVAQQKLLRRHSDGEGPSKA